MKIKWYGHACFRVEGGGISIVTDPYTPGVAGLDPVDEPADVVIMSSATDRFHSCSSMVPGDPEVLNALELKGVSVLHLGDLGNPIPDEQLARLRGRVDILLALTGGPPTIELDDLDRAIEEIEPSKSSRCTTRYPASGWTSCPSKHSPRATPKTS